MLHQLNIFLLCFGALQGVLLGLILLRNRRRHPSSIYLTLFLTLVGLQLTFKVITKSWLMDNVAFLYGFSYMLPFLAGPLMYLFIRARTTDRSFRLMDVSHFIPFLVEIGYVFMITRYGYLYTTPADRWLVTPYPKGVLQAASIILYSWRSIILISAGAKESTSVPARDGLQEFVMVTGVSELLIIVAITVLQAYYSLMPDIRLLFIALTVLIYWISYKLVSRPDVFLPGGGVLVPLRLDSQPKYSHSGLKPEEADRIAGLLRAAMTQQRLYMKPDLTIDTLAAELKISRHYLSQVLNEKFQQTYFDFVNGYRLEEASARLTGQKYRHYTIAAIAVDSGFSSVSNFNEVFKKRFGATPSRFRDEHTGKMSA